MDERVKKELIAIVGPDRATDQPEDLVAYSYDPYIREHRPDLVLYPLSTEEVSAIMKVADREEIPVTPRGSGTNLAGETVAVKGGIVLAFSRMDRILEIDRDNRLARVQPGVINFDFQREVAKYGLMYPPDPSSWTVCTIGGNVGTNAGGPKTLKYGVTRDYLLGLTAVLANGDVLKTGGRAIKNVTGYDLTRLLCGSEGTLGIITEIMVRLIPQPLATRTLRADFPRLEDSSTAVAAIIGAGIVPAGLELMDKVVIAAVEADAHLGLPTDVEAILLVEIDGDPESLEIEQSKIEQILKANNASGVVAAQSDAEAEKLWTARRAAFSVMARLRPNAVIEDATVPVSQLTAIIRKTVEIAEKHHVEIGVLAHAGDGNLHPLVLFDQRDEDELARAEQATEEIFREALALGGTLSGEHGIGMAKARFLPLELDSVAMSVTRSIKESLDPKGILNPGKFV
ncbi:MAG: FAD-linked oxidase C-terminal domain-containing protein [Deltaproteobacteria bacterium]